MSISGIYKIQSQRKPEKIYIGSAVDIHKRWQIHLGRLKRNKHENARLQNHYNKYGKDDFVFSILIGCDKQDLISTEQFYIDAYNPSFNICKKAANCLGVKHSLETRQKVSAANRGEKHRNYGKHLSEETRRKISEAHKGRNRSPEHIKKLADARRGQVMPPQIREKISKSTKGINTWSLGNKNASGERDNAFKERMREVNLGKTHSDETKERMRIAHTNPSEETLRKRSEGLKRAWALRKLKTVNVN